MLLSSPYRKNQTVFDRITRDYYKIERIRIIKIKGIWRTFYKLKGLVGTTPDQSWRELQELTHASFRNSSLLEG